MSVPDVSKRVVHEKPLFRKNYKTLRSHKNKELKEKKKD